MKKFTYFLFGSALTLLFVAPVPVRAAVTATLTVTARVPLSSTYAQALSDHSRAQVQKPRLLAGQSLSLSGRVNDYRRGLANHQLLLTIEQSGRQISQWQTRSTLDGNWSSRGITTALLHGEYTIKVTDVAYERPVLLHALPLTVIPLVLDPVTARLAFPSLGMTILPPDPSHDISSSYPVVHGKIREDKSDYFIDHEGQAHLDFIGRRHSRDGPGLSIAGYFYPCRRGDQQADQFSG